MEKFAPEMETMLNENLELYRQMNRLLTQERQFIVNIDVDSLSKSAERKKKIAEEIQQIREDILTYLKKTFGDAEVDPEHFCLSHIIQTLPLSTGQVSRLRNIKSDLEKQMDDLNRTAAENKKYVLKYLSVIDDVMSVVMDHSEQPRNRKSDVLPEARHHGFLIHAGI